MLKMTWRSKLTLVLCKRDAYKTAVHRETSVLADKTWRKHYLLCCIRKINRKAEFSGAFPDASFETKTSAQGGFPTYIFASHPAHLSSSFVLSFSQESLYLYHWIFLSLHCVFTLEQITWTGLESSIYRSFQWIHNCLSQLWVT